MVSKAGGFRAGTRKPVVHVVAMKRAQASSKTTSTAFARKMREIDVKLDAAHKMADETLAAIQAMNRK